MTPLLVQYSSKKEGSVSLPGGRPFAFEGSIQAWQGAVHMPYPAKIGPGQWAEIERRAAAGESVCAIAADFGVSEGALRKRGISKAKVLKVRKVAEQLAAAQAEVAALPPSQQALAISLADELRAISANLADAARFGSATASMLHRAANQEVLRADMESRALDEPTLRAVAMATRTANEAGAIGLALLKNNEEAMREAAEREAAAKLKVSSISLVPMTSGS